MASDVTKARRSMNFSRWSVQNGRKPEIAIATLAAACSGMQSGSMPKWNYLLMHPEARVTKLEADQFCVWSAGEVRQLVKKKRRNFLRTASE